MLQLLGCSGPCRPGYDLMVCIVVHDVGQRMWWLKMAKAGLLGKWLGWLSYLGVG